MAEKKIEATTPKGIANYPKLNEPDTKFEPRGSFNTKLIFEDAGDAAVEAFIAKAHAVRDEFFEKTIADLKAEGKGAVAKQLKKVDLLKLELDKETGDETGRVYVTAKMLASGVRKKDGKPWSQKPVYYAASGKQLQNPPRIGGGSVVKLGVEIDPYLMASSKEVGVTLRLKAVQIIRLVTGGQRSFDGFEAEEGDEIEDEAPFDAGTAGSDDNSDDGL